MTPYIHPERRPVRRRPLKAVRHMRNLIADKEDTEQVFHIIEALNGNALKNDLLQFAKSESGQARMAERTDIPSLLDDHESLKSLPAGTVGRAYQSFMEREGLSAAGLIAETTKFFEGKRRFEDDLDWYGDLRRDTHDMLHILTGYGRDALGEASVLAFAVGQHKGLGSTFISYVAGRQIQKQAPAGVNIADVIAQGKANGKAAQIVAREDFRTLVKEPIELARARLGINPATLYHDALAKFTASGLEPAVAPA